MILNWDPSCPAIFGKRQLEISKKSEKTKIELRVQRYRADFADQNKKNQLSSSIFSDFRAVFVSSLKKHKMQEN